MGGGGGREGEEGREGGGCQNGLAGFVLFITSSHSNTRLCHDPLRDMWAMARYFKGALVCNWK